MNCREAEQHIFAERDGALDNTQRAALASHVAGCAHCSRVQLGFAAAIDGWRTETRQVRVPDSELEWQKLRREIRGGAGSKTAAASARRSPVVWFGIPIAAAAALAVAFVTNSSSPTPNPTTEVSTVARANSAPAIAEKPSTVVFTDEKSGWTFVVATDNTHRG